MKCKVGDKMIYYKTVEEEGNSLIDFKTYIITNVSFYMKRDLGFFYSVDDKYPINWYKEENFKFPHELRNIKLKKLNESR